MPDHVQNSCRIMAYNHAFRIYKSLGYEPTTLQIRAANAIINDYCDVLITAPTGYGKTEAAVIPAISYATFCKSKLLGAESHKQNIIYVTPLRALNRDLNLRISKIAEAAGDFSVDVWHSDTPETRRKKILQDPPNMLITTPESLSILLIKNALKDWFKHLAFVIVDEVQELVDDERGTLLAIELVRIDHKAGRHVRRIAISGPIGDLGIAAEFLFGTRSYCLIEADTGKQYDIEVLSACHDLTLQPLDCLIQGLASVKPKLRGQTIVFVNTRSLAEAIAMAVRGFLVDGYVPVHHSSLSRSRREEVEKMLRDGSINMVFATSSLELGIDIGGVDQVIQILSPRQASKLLQRIGRAGHRMTSSSRGMIITLPSIVEIIESAVLAKRAARGNLEKVEPHRNSLDILLHQLIGLAIQEGSIRYDEAFALFRRATPYSYLSLDEFDKVVSFAVEAGFLKRGDGDLLEPTRRGEIYYLTTTPIVEPARFLVKSFPDGKPVGSIDEEFVFECEQGDVIVLGGRLWRLLDINEDRREVIVEPVVDTLNVVLPKWFGELIPVDGKASREIASVYRRLCEEEPSKVLDDYLIRDEQTKSIILNSLHDLCRLGISEKRFVIEIWRVNPAVSVMAIYHNLGSRGGRALGVVISIVLSKLAKDYTVRAHHLALIVVLKQEVTREFVLELINELKKFVADQEMLKDALTKSPEFKWAVYSVARKMGIIKPEVPLSEAKKLIQAISKIDVVRAEALRELLKEKYDFESSLRLLEEIRKGRVGIRVLIRTKPSRMLRELLMQDATTKTLNVDLDKRILDRLAKRRLKLICLNCLHEIVVDIPKLIDDYRNRIREPLRCPKCSSVFLAPVEDDVEKEKVKSILKRSTETPSKRISIEAEHILKKYSELASINADLGVAGLIALQALGIGPHNVKYVVKDVKTFDELLNRMIASERRFLQYRKYWMESR